MKALYHATEESPEPIGSSLSSKNASGLTFSRHKQTLLVVMDSGKIGNSILSSLTEIAAAPASSTQQESPQPSYFM